MRRAGLLLVLALMWVAAVPHPTRAQSSPVRGIYNWIHSTGDAERSFAFYRDLFGLELARSPFAGRAPANAPPERIRPVAEAGSDPLVWDLTNTHGSRFRTVFMRAPNTPFGLELSEFFDVPRGERSANPWDPGAATLVFTVRDLGAAVSKLRARGAPVVTLGGNAIDSPSGRAILVRDPDGCLVVVRQAAAAAVAAATAPGEVIETSIGISVARLPRALDFYKGLLGLSVSEPRTADPAELRLNGLAAGRITQAVVSIPGPAAARVVLSEFSLPARAAQVATPFAWRIQDVGAPQFQLEVAGLDALIERTTRAGYRFLSVGAKPIQRPFGRFVFAIDPDGVLVEFVEPVSRTPTHERDRLPPPMTGDDMNGMRVLGAAALCVAATIGVSAQARVPDTPESLVSAAKRAAGGDYSGTFLRICVAPDNLAAAGPRGAGPGPRVVPDRANWYAKPYKVFDDLYFVGTRIHSAWALTTSDGIIVIDTLFDYAIEPEIVDGLTALGLDPRSIKYVLISHAHGDHDQGAALLQRRYGAKIVMGAADWESTLQRPSTAPGGVPTRDVVVGPGGLKLKLGDTTVDVIATPGHTPGTLSYFFPVKDGGRTLMVAYAGGTAFNFPRRPENFAVYRDSQRKMTEVAAAAGASVLITNHTEFDRAFDRVRLAQLPRAAGEKHPYETDTATVLRYFEMGADCAEAQRLSMK